MNDSKKRKPNLTIDTNSLTSTTSASPSSENSLLTPLLDEEVDFSLVYSLHTFVATLEGQVAVTRNEQLILLDDSNSYWWLVKPLNSNTIGYIPAEMVEMPYERLARINRHRNIEIAQLRTDDIQGIPSKSTKRQSIHKKNVQFNEDPCQDYFEYSPEGSEVSSFDNPSDDEDEQEKNSTVTESDLVNKVNSRDESAIAAEDESYHQDNEDEEENHIIMETTKQIILSNNIDLNDNYISDNSNNDSSTSDDITRDISAMIQFENDKTNKDNISTSSKKMTIKDHAGIHRNSLGAGLLLSEEEKDEPYNATTVESSFPIKDAITTNTSNVINSMNSSDNMVKDIKSTETIDSTSKLESTTTTTNSQLHAVRRVSSLVASRDRGLIPNQLSNSLKTQVAPMPSLLESSLLTIDKEPLPLLSPAEEVEQARELSMNPITVLRIFIGKCHTVVGSMHFKTVVVSKTMTVHNLLKQATLKYKVFGPLSGQPDIELGTNSAKSLLSDWYLTLKIDINQEHILQPDENVFELLKRFQPEMQTSLHRNNMKNGNGQLSNEDEMNSTIHLSGSPSTLNVRDDHQTKRSVLQVLSLFNFSTIQLLLNQHSATETMMRKHNEKLVQIVLFGRPLVGLAAADDTSESYLDADLQQEEPTILMSLGKRRPSTSISSGSNGGMSRSTGSKAINVIPIKSKARIRMAKIVKIDVSEHASIVVTRALTKFSVAGGESLGKAEEYNLYAIDDANVSDESDDNHKSEEKIKKATKTIGPPLDMTAPLPVFSLTRKLSKYLLRRKQVWIDHSLSLGLPSQLKSSTKNSTFSKTNYPLNTTGNANAIYIEEKMYQRTIPPSTVTNNVANAEDILLTQNEVSEENTSSLSKSDNHLTSIDELSVLHINALCISGSFVGSSMVPVKPSVITSNPAPHPPRRGSRAQVYQQSHAYPQKQQ